MGVDNSIGNLHIGGSSSSLTHKEHTMKTKVHASSKARQGELAGRIVFVTGGSRGIGLAIADAMARSGATVLVSGRNKKDLASTLLFFHKRRVSCRAYIADAGDAEQIARVFADIKRDFGRLDILVNNIGGVRQFSDFHGLADSDWQEVFDLNLMSMVRFSRAAFPLLRKSRYGRVINIASVAGKRPGNFNPHYGAMKAAMIHLSKYLSNQWARHKILVNAICPATVKGGVWERDVANKAKMRNLPFGEAERLMLEEVTAKSPLHEICMPEDIGNLAVFLASDKARFITGTCIMADGGTVNSIF